MRRRLAIVAAALIGTALVTLPALAQAAEPELPAPVVPKLTAPPVMHVGLNGGLGPLIASTRAGTTGFSWGFAIEGYADGIGESGLGLREIRLGRQLAGQPYNELWRQIRLRSSVATFADRQVIASWQGGVIMQEFERGGQTGSRSGIPGARDSHLGGEIGARLDWVPLKQISPYVGAALILGDLGNPVGAQAPSAGMPTQTGGNAFGFSGQTGLNSRWPVSIAIGESRYVAEVGGTAEAYWFTLFGEHLLGLDLRLGVYF